MATRTAFSAPTNASDTVFRAWINDLHNHILVGGWVQTSDTGQINFSTASAPSGVGNFPGFAVYKMADSFQASAAPFFMRIDFGESAGTADAPAIKIKCGIGSTDGAGTLTGVLSTQITTSCTASADATNYTTRSSGGTSWLGLNMWANGALSGGVNGWTIIIERDKDSSGADTSLGVNILFQYNSATNGQTKSSQFLETAGGVGSKDDVWYAMTSNQTCQAMESAVGVGPVRCQLGPFRNPMIGCFVCSRTDFILNATYPLTIYGASHTYMMLRPSYGVTASLLNLVISDSAFGMRWE